MCCRAVSLTFSGPHHATKPQAAPTAAGTEGATDKLGRTAFMWAAANGHERVLSKMIKFINSKDEGKVLLDRMYSMTDAEGNSAGMLAALQYRNSVLVLAGYLEKEDYMTGVAKRSNDSKCSQEQHDVVQRALTKLREETLSTKRAELAGGPLIRLVLYGWHTRDVAFLMRATGTRT